MKNSNIIDIAKAIISTEIEGVVALKESIDSSFIEACEMLLNLKGKLIVTGMGKSGHIANKIAATMASTGTTAFFVHPAEALHGDLGMIAKNDIVLAISNSGNTQELSGILSYAQRFDIPVIGITAGKDSTLAEISNVVLLLPDAKEACSLGLAPTTSTTNTLVMGDTLAITLLELKGFKSEDFRIFHPGGSLGNKLLKIADVMHKDQEIPLVKAHTNMKDAIIAITSYRFGCVGIVDDNNNIIGIVTDGDIRKHMSDNFFTLKVEDIMTKDFLFISANDTTANALLTMQKNSVTNLFVLEGKKAVGIVHIHDLLKIGVV